jgi:hypothetical protein
MLRHPVNSRFLPLKFPPITSSITCPSPANMAIFGSTVSYLASSPPNFNFFEMKQLMRISSQSDGAGI